MWDQLELQNGILYRNIQTIGQSFLQFLVPAAMKNDVMKLAHGSRTGGHFGRTKTFKKIQRSYYWLGYSRDISVWVKRCEQCAKRKAPAPKFRTSLQQTLVGAPFERIALDIFGPLPRSRNGNCYILIVMDYFTKWAEAYPIRNQEAETIV